ncbi:hypothetical protein FD755_014993 [Muntiacus reevesi]|uniref:V-type proton ATPase subunit G n=2 Tax=Muntiacus TaxID=9885 RepID=A0A5N3XJ93_MUNRE|nr:hypothetical protein FD754_016357 [Muntiacus muntjak]KAB0373334.1 hypothetical protein FD755_014993 [Muntiacus reevesi]
MDCVGFRQLICNGLSQLSFKNFNWRIIVLQCRVGKNRRLKQAKEEAQAEIEQYRLQREKEFKAKEAAALGSHGSCSTEVEKDTQEKMTILQTYFRQNRDEVLDNLLAFVCDIRPEIHENYRING